MCHVVYTYIVLLLKGKEKHNNNNTLVLHIGHYISNKPKYLHYKGAIIIEQQVNFLLWSHRKHSFQLKLPSLFAA